MKSALRLAFILLAASVLGALAATNRPPDPVLQPVPDTPGLPRVLLIGDSISLGYTLPVRKLLVDTANVHRPPTNCGDTARGVRFLDAWLGTNQWAVIHFNFGLHDLKYLDAKGNLVAPDQGHQVASLAQYEKNLRELVARLKRTGAKLIWATTTPVPDGASGRVRGDELRYNEVAARVMSESGVAVEDLHAVAARQKELQLPRNVHFSPAGYQALARSVAASILKELAP